MNSAELEAMTVAMCKVVTEQIGKATYANEVEALAKVAAVAVEAAKILGFSQ